MKVYSSKEERINVISHAIGFLLSIVALVLLIKKANTYGNSQSVLSVTIYGMSLIVLYAASTLFHSAKHGTLRKRFQIFDHAAIFVLIAGTYTPFALISLPDSTGKRSEERRVGKECRTQVWPCHYIKKIVCVSVCNYYSDD